jgi:hypothetical protein
MGGVRKTTKPQKLKLSKGAKARLNSINKKTNDKGSTGPTTEDQRFIENNSSESSSSKQKDNSKQGPIKVSSTRVGPNQPKSIGGPSSFVPQAGPSQITPPGPTARESAASKAAAAKKGTKNTSTMRVAQKVVDLEAPGFPTVYNITDVPRQWKKNG